MSQVPYSARYAVGGVLDGRDGLPRVVRVRPDGEPPGVRPQHLDAEAFKLPRRNLRFRYSMAAGLTIPGQDGDDGGRAGALVTT